MNGPNHPNEQSKKRSRKPELVDTPESPRNGRSSKGPSRNHADLIGPHEQAKVGPPGPITSGSGPIGPHEQAVVTVVAEPVDPPPPPPQLRSSSRGKNGASVTESARPPRLRFHLELKARLAKDKEIFVCVKAPDRTRGPITIESLRITVYNKKKDSSFQGEVALRKDANIKPGLQAVFPLSEAQQKDLQQIVKSKTIAVLTAVYTAPAETQVRFSIDDRYEHED